MALERLDSLSPAHRDDIHELFQQVGWADQRSRESVDSVIDGSDEFVAFADDGTVVAFARGISDYTFKAFVYDVIVHEDHRGEGLGERVVDAMVDHPALGDVEHFELFCKTRLIPFYEQWDFEALEGRTMLQREHN
jgi:GNAT superfamily N-acetyltransferase